MEIKESEFDKLVEYTLRIELLDGKVLIYRIDTENKQYLIRRLRENSSGDDDIKTLRFLWFETALNRSVIINSDSLTRITFCYDVGAVQDGRNYVDNFDLAYNEEESIEVEAERDKILKDEELFLPQAIIYHKGKTPEDNYDKNPLTYDSLSEGCLCGFDMELEGEWTLRQFINLIDNDGEETFMPLEQIVVMEFETNLMNLEEEPEDKNMEEDEKDEKDFTLLN